MCLHKKEHNMQSKLCDSSEYKCCTCANAQSRGHIDATRVLMYRVEGILMPHGY